MTGRWDYDEVLDLDLVGSWVTAGATLVGGCCGTGPADIAALAARIRS
jgi:homocysteine S-methyltransferase